MNQPPQRQMINDPMGDLSLDRPSQPEEGKSESETDTSNEEVQANAAVEELETVETASSTKQKSASKTPR